MTESTDKRTDDGNPPEHPDNFSRTPGRDPEARREELGDLPARTGPNQAFIMVMLAAIVLAILLGFLLFVVR